MGLYTEARTEFVRQKIKDCTWADRYYITRLLSIERILIDGIKGQGDGMVLSSCRREYPDEYWAIFFELFPKRAARERRDETAWAAQSEREKLEKEQERVERERRDLEDWLKAGGQP